MGRECQDESKTRYSFDVLLSSYKLCCALAFLYLPSHKPHTLTSPHPSFHIAKAHFDVLWPSTDTIMPWNPFHLRCPRWLRAEKSVPGNKYQKLDSEDAKTGLFSSTNTPVCRQDPEVSQSLSHLSSYPNAQVANQKSFNRNNLQTATYNRQRAMADQNREAAAPVARQATSESSNPRGDTHTPYTISSGEWCPTWNTANDNLHVHHIPEKQMKARWESVLSVASIVYGIAKVFLTICQNFGVEVCRVDSLSPLLSQAVDAC
ncbi:hypothetical protein VTN96DRAFT_1083 [Rasamsonia emersonii]